METLKKRIIKDGIVLEGNILKVDSFLNHNIDIELLKQIGEELHRRFKDCCITKIITVEASGISVAIATAMEFNVPVVFAKKGNTNSMDKSIYSQEAFSHTKGEAYIMNISKKYLNDNDTVLIIDDFLAKGITIEALLGIVKQSGAQLAGIGIVIEKAFQKGGDGLREKGIRLESLAVIKSMDEGVIKFK